MDLITSARVMKAMGGASMEVQGLIGNRTGIGKWATMAKMPEPPAVNVVAVT